jgi:hypothetical protein
MLVDEGLILSYYFRRRVTGPVHAFTVREALVGMKWPALVRRSYSSLVRVTQTAISSFSE